MSDLERRLSQALNGGPPVPSDSGVRYVQLQTGTNDDGTPVTQNFPCDVATVLLLLEINASLKALIEAAALAE